jgi:hypothetical protein
VAQEVEHLPSKSKALSSKPVPPKKNIGGYSGICGFGAGELGPLYLQSQGNLCHAGLCLGKTAGRAQTRIPLVLSLCSLQ